MSETVDIGGWQDIATAPKDGKYVILAFKNHYGKWRRVIGFYAQEGTVCANEDSDDEFAPPGWYEYHDAYEEYESLTDQLPILWQPLPPPPESAP